MNRFTYSAAPFVAAAALTLILVPTAAEAREKPSNVTAVWWAQGTDQWPAEGQTLAASTKSDTLDVAFIEATATSLGCGFTIQGDLYADDKITKSLLAGGKLFGPSNPTESWPGGKYKAEFSTVFYTGDCPVEPVLTDTTVTAESVAWSCTDGVYTGNQITFSAPNADLSVVKDGLPFDGPLTGLGVGQYVLTFTPHDTYQIVGEDTFTFDLVQPTEGCTDPCDLEASECTPVEPPLCDPTQQACGEVPATNPPACDPTAGDCLVTTGIETDAAILAGLLAILGAGLVVWARINRRKNLA